MNLVVVWSTIFFSFSFVLVVVLDVGRFLSMHLNAPKANLYATLLLANGTFKFGGIIFALFAFFFFATPPFSQKPLSKRRRQ
jgi:hypothetical protein